MFAEILQNYEMGVLINIRSVVQCLAGNLKFEDMTSYQPS